MYWRKSVAIRWRSPAKFSSFVPRINKSASRSINWMISCVRRHSCSYMIRFPLTLKKSFRFGGLLSLYVSEWEEYPVVRQVWEISWWSCCKSASIHVHEWNTAYWNKSSIRLFLLAWSILLLHLSGRTIFVLPFLRLSNTFEKALNTNFSIVFMSFRFVTINGCQ